MIANKHKLVTINELWSVNHAVARLDYQVICQEDAL